MLVIFKLAFDPKRNSCFYIANKCSKPYLVYITNMLRTFASIVLYNE